MIRDGEGRQRKEGDWLRGSGCVVLSCAHHVNEALLDAVERGPQSAADQSHA